VRVVRGLDVVDYLLAADLLLTDASSVAIEYTLLDRPIVFIDVPKLLKNVTRRGAPLDLTTHGRKIGSLARTPAEVVREIESGLERPGERGELRRATARDVFHDPGGATERVVSIVRWAAGLQPDLPRGIEALEP
jgi:CDP-glycerol glycerophosphotransferase (TagB/SpsB family)